MAFKEKDNEKNLQGSKRFSNNGFTILYLDRFSRIFPGQR